MSNEGREKRIKKKISKRSRKDSTTNVGKPKNLQNIVLQHSDNWTNNPECVRFVIMLTNFGRFNQHQRTKQVVESRPPKKVRENLNLIHEQLKKIETDQGEGALYYIFKKQKNFPVFRDGYLDTYMDEILPQEIMEKSSILSKTWQLLDRRFLTDICKYLNNENLVIQAGVELGLQDTLIRCSVARYLISNTILPDVPIVKWFNHLDENEEAQILMFAHDMKDQIMGIIQENVRQNQRPRYVQYESEFFVNQSQESIIQHSNTNYTNDDDV